MIFERHPLGSQAFMRLGVRPFPVAVASSGDFDPVAVRFSRANPRHGVNDAKRAWRHVQPALEAESDFLVTGREDRAGPDENLDEIQLTSADRIRGIR